MWLFVRIRPFLALVSFVESAIIEITKKPPPPPKKVDNNFPSRSRGHGDPATLSLSSD